MYSWSALQAVNPKSYTCGSCGNVVSSNSGLKGSKPSTASEVFIRICPQCKNPTFFDDQAQLQLPNKSFGADVNDIEDKKVADLYDEARKCYSAGSYTGVVLLCRKLLMHIACSKGADENKKFIEYVEYLQKEHFIPPGADSWVDHIRQKGNEANHEIVIMSNKEAENLLVFSEMLLKLVYEFPQKLSGQILSPSIEGE